VGLAGRSFISPIGDSSYSPQTGPRSKIFAHAASLKDSIKFVEARGASNSNKEIVGPEKAPLVDLWSHGKG
jgi:hypothetical protein